MGFVADVAKGIRDLFRKDKERAALQVAKGSTNAAYPSHSGDLLSAYGYDVVSDYLRLEHDLMARYVDYEEMDDYPEISAAIDIFADDATQVDSQINRTVWVTSKDRNIQENLGDMFQRTLRIDEEIWEIARTLVKYGNDLEEILVTEEGVRGLNFLPPATMRRVEGPRGHLYGFLQDFKGKFGYSAQEFREMLAARVSGQASGDADADRVAALEDWEVAHFRLRGKQRRSVYGYSTLEPARWIWKRLNLLEDSALIYRLQRAPERYAFYVDVGDLPPAEAMAYLNRVRQQFKKKKYVNPSTGKLDLKFDPLSQDEDFFVPTRKGQDGTRIEVLGAPQWQHMDDIEYFRDKMFAAIKIPKAYLAQDQNTARAVLSSEDVRFARTVLRVQRELRNGLGKIGRVHLAALGIDPGAVEFDIHMTVPSSVFELAQLEVRNARADLAGRMREFVSLHWILERVFGLSEDEIQQVIKERGEDVKRDTMSQAEAEATAQEKFGPPPEAAFPPEAAPASPPELPAGTEEAERRRWRRLAEARSRRVSSLPGGRRSGITEQELMRGDRESERRAEGKLEKLLQNDHHMARRLQELGGLLLDLRASGGSKRR